MDQPVPIGLDLAKSVFEMHGADAEGRVVLRCQLRRSQVLGFFERLGPCLVGMEACSGAHHRARELIGLGHEVRLMPPACVKPYAKRGKTDGEGDRGCRAAAQAPERCRGDLRGGDAAQFKPVRANGTNDPVDRSTAQNALRAGDVGRAAGGAARPQRARDFPVRQRPQTVNAIRAPLSEFGIVTAKASTTWIGCSKRPATCPGQRDPRWACSPEGCAIWRTGSKRRPRRSPRTRRPTRSPGVWPPSPALAPSRPPPLRPPRPTGRRSAPRATTRHGSG